MLTSNILNFTLAKRRHERPEGLRGGQGTLGHFLFWPQSWDPPHYDNSAGVSQCFSLCRLLSPWIPCPSTAPINWQSLPIYRPNQVSRWRSPEANETLGKSMALSHAVTTHSMSTHSLDMVERTVYNQHIPNEEVRDGCTLGIWRPNMVMLQLIVHAFITILKLLQKKALS